MVQIKWLAHASFLIEGDGLRIITDPYEPNEVINLPPITEPADIVIRSSDDDEAHCFVDTLPPGFDLITATDIVDAGATVRGLKVDAIWSQESHIHKEVVRDNAMYRFALEGINISHMGDVGNPLTKVQMDALAGTDILLALTGGPPTIELEDLQKVIAYIKPKVVITVIYQNIQKSPTYESGFALRFPRLTALRHDRSPSTAATLSEVKHDYDKMHK